jgi:hypothetical protein
VFSLHTLLTFKCLARNNQPTEFDINAWLKEEVWAEIFEEKAEDTLGEKPWLAQVMLIGVVFKFQFF